MQRGGLGVDLDLAADDVLLELRDLGGERRADGGVAGYDNNGGEQVYTLDLGASSWTARTLPSTAWPAFAGMALAFADGFARAGSESHASMLAGVAGDALGVLAGIAWAATTVVVRATKLAHTSASKTLFYQLAVSAVVLLALSVPLGQVRVATVTPLVVASLAYQAVAVAFISYLIWFWLLTRYMASRLSVFSFLTPLFGVTFGVLLLGESFSLRFLMAAMLVLAGIALVNAPARRRAT